MTHFNKSFRALTFGGLFFIIPIVMIVFVIKQVYGVLHPIGNLLSEEFGLNSLFGKSAVLIVTIILLLFICFLAGLLIEKGLVKNWSASFEKKLFVVLPSLQMFKFRLFGDKSVAINDIWQGVIFKEDTFYKIGFITEKKENHTAIYIPDAPKIDAGEVRYMINSEFEYYPISMKDAMAAIYNFGEGLDIEAIIAASKKA
jgi:uncharacterized membrane protein